MPAQENVVITGVSTGIGNDAVGHLISKGFHVFGSVRKDVDVERLTAQYPENFTCLRFDVTKMNEVKSAFEIVEKSLGGRKLSGLINNAGLALGGPIELMDDDSFRYQMEVNLFAVRNVTNVFLPLLKGDKKAKISGGKIIMISSISGVFNTPFNGAYCISKHALESLAEIYRRELMMFDIDVVSIQPGPIESKLWDKNINKYEEYADSEYQFLMLRANKIMKSAERSALPAAVISKLIYKILTKKRTKLAYLIHKNWLATTMFVKFTPAKLVDRLLYRNLFEKSGE